VHEEISIKTTEICSAFRVAFACDKIDISCASVGNVRRIGCRFLRCHVVGSSSQAYYHKRNSAMDDSIGTS
jgi:hypothetical protein